MLNDFEMLSGRISVKVNANYTVVTISTSNALGQTAALLLRPSEARELADMIHETLVTKEPGAMEVQP